MSALYAIQELYLTVIYRTRDYLDDFLLFLTLGADQAL
jgi:hypothetical protein